VSQARIRMGCEVELLPTSEAIARRNAVDGKI
jgi:hypothetical protein